MREGVRGESKERNKKWEIGFIFNFELLSDLRVTLQDNLLPPSKI